MKIKLLTVILIVLSSASLSYAQEGLEKLEKELLNESLTPKEKFKIYDDLSWEYQYSNFEKACKYAAEGIDFARKHDNLKLEGVLTRNMGMAYYCFGKLDSAAIIFDKAMKIAFRSENLALVSGIHSALGDLYNVQSKYDRALKHYIESIKYSEKTGNKVSTAIVTGNMGTMYSNMRNYPKAEKYMLKAKALAEELNHKNLLACMLANLNNLYNVQGEFTKSLDYSKRAASLFHELGDYSGEIVALLSSASTYSNYYKDYQKAIQSATQGMELAKKYNLKRELSASHRNLCFIYEAMQNYTAAKEHALVALSLADTTDSDSRIEMYSYLTKIFIELGNHQEAKKYFDLYQKLILKNSDKGLQESLSEMEVKYETEKKEMKIAEMQKEHQLMLWLGISALSILLLLILLLYFRFRIVRQKKKLAEQQVAQMEKEKQLVATHALLEGETTERVRLSKDLHDGLGGLLSVTKHKIATIKDTITIPDNSLVLFNSALETLDTSIKELRRVAHNLMPASLMQYGLNVALKDYCNGIGIVEYHFFGSDKRFDEKLEITCFRIVCELVNNAFKHAKAKSINVQVVQEDNRISIAVIDDGCGFDASQVETKKSGGLYNLKSRVDSFNGRLDVISSPNNGTEISVEFTIQ